MSLSYILITIKKYTMYNIYNIRIKNWRAYFGLGILPIIKLSLLEPVTRLFDILIILITLSAYFAFTFGINNYYDRHEDILEGDQSKNPIAFGNLSTKSALIFLLSILTLGILISIIYIRSILPKIIYLLLIFLSWAYSAHPLRLKSRYLFDVISHGLYFGSLIFLYSYLVLFENLSVNDLLLNPLIYLIFLYSVSLELRNELEDFEFDKNAGLNTTAVILGKERTIKTITCILLLHWMIVLVYFSVASMYSWYFAVPVILTTLALISKLWLENHRWYRINDICVIPVYILITLII
ncbi:MAG: UbiA family prenyltransferase [Candidatus Asgardarchaeia archaeon]